MFRKKHKAYNEKEEEYMFADALIIDAGTDTVTELYKRVFNNNSSVKEELEKDPQLAKQLYVLTGIEMSDN